MKLVEILAKELGEWPDGATHAVQDGKRSFLRKVWVCNGDQANTEHDGCQWILGRGVFPCESIRATELATDHATAIVTREMWQAERDKHSCERVEEVAADILSRTAKDSGYICWMRDRIREIDATIEAMTAERAELVSKLAGEGFALIAVAAEPVEDMSDWRDWRVGDRIEVLAGSECDTGVFAVIELESSDYDGDLPARLANIGWPELCYMRWHSRPTS